VKNDVAELSFAEGEALTVAKTDASVSSSPMRVCALCHACACVGLVAGEQRERRAGLRAGQLPQPRYEIRLVVEHTYRCVCRSVSCAYLTGA
jgi:hypothetical protein